MFSERGLMALVFGAVAAVVVALPEQQRSAPELYPNAYQMNGEAYLPLHFKNCMTFRELIKGIDQFPGDEIVFTSPEYMVVKWIQQMQNGPFMSVKYHQDVYAKNPSGAWCLTKATEEA